MNGKRPDAIRAKEKRGSRKRTKYFFGKRRRRGRGEVYERKALVRQAHADEVRDHKVVENVNVELN